MPRGRKKKSEIVLDDSVIDSGIGPIDAHVGSRICARRRLLQLSQKQMAEKLGVTFQQVQKYEKGMNRIGAGRLYTIATILGVGVDYFFGDIDDDIFDGYPEFNRNEGIGFFHEDDVDMRFDPMKGAEATMLLKAFYSLPPRARASLLTLLASLKDNREDFDLDV